MRLVKEEVAKEARCHVGGSLPESKVVGYSKALVVVGAVEVARLVSNLQMVVAL